MNPILPAILHFDAYGLPYSKEFSDVYHSRAGGLSQAQQVFLAGNQLPERWRGRDFFIILETGFGLGLNFLATWQAWRTDPTRCTRLHFISCELHPFGIQDLAQLHARLFTKDPELLELARELRTAWPMPICGLHRLELAKGQIVLTLAFGQAEDLLNQIAARVDAFYFDGFSPKHNPGIWSYSIFQQCARLSASGATLASWCVAKDVRQALIHAGFVVEKKVGFANKRERLTGYFRGQRAPNIPSSKKILIIGAGIAGAAAARQLARRGFQCTVLEAQGDIATKASGNLLGIICPRLSRDNNLQSQLLSFAFFYVLEILKNADPLVGWRACGALQLARDQNEANRLYQLPEYLELPRSFACSVNQKEASEKAGFMLSTGGLWFPQAGFLHPPALVRSWLSESGAAVDCHAQVAHIKFHEGFWRAHDKTGTILGTAPLLVLANGVALKRFAPELALSESARVVSLLQDAPKISCILTGRAYLTPDQAGWSALGASPASKDAEIINFSQLNKMLAQSHSAQHLASWLCTRPVSRDHLPVIGQLLDIQRYRPEHASARHLLIRRPGLYVLGGLGSHGLLQAALCAEVLACQITAEPLPIARHLAYALDPARFGTHTAIL